MPFTIDPELIENDDVRIATDSSNNFVLENKRTGDTIQLNDGGTLQADSVDANSVSTGDQTINNSLTYGTHDIGAVLEATADGKRLDAGLVGLSNWDGTSDGTWDTVETQSTPIGFGEAFSNSDPVVLAGNYAGGSGGNSYLPGVQNASTTGFDFYARYYRSGGQIMGTPTSSWVAVGDD